jgi:hypothetical protein
MIPDYLDRLERELSFDRSLARSVRQEVEDHLWEAVAADRTGNAVQAQQRAIANFGDARVIAAGFAVTSLGIHSRRAGVAAVLVIASVFVAMKARVAWYAATQWAISDDMRAMPSGWRLWSVSAAGPISEAARSLSRYIRPIAGGFAASFCCVVWPPPRLSFRCLVMQC